jgi:peptide/nickel transport system substrate-binding protein
MRNPTLFAILAVSLVLAACQPARVPGQPGEAAQPAGAPRAGASGGTLTMAVRYEAEGLARKATTARGTNATIRIFNAGISLVDGKGEVHPYLLESLPRLNTDAWRVAPDGTMEITYRLKENLRWHDGQPLVAEDFAFAYAAFTAPGLGMFSPRPQNFIDGVEARDPRTFVIRWNRPYPDAIKLEPGDFEPLPRHLLQESFRQFEQDPVSGQDLFRNQRYWTHEYIGSGPFKLERWDPGSEIVGVAFDGHALGRPKLDRLVIKIFSDENAVLSNLLAASVDLATEFTLRYEHAKVLQAEWESNKRGMVLLDRGAFHYTMTQFRPDAQKTPALLDLRVRRALAHTIDRKALNEGLFDGQGFETDSVIPNDERYYGQLDRTITHHPYDPRRTDQLLSEAGFAKDGSGFYASPAAGRLQFDNWTISGTLFERTQAILGETWSRAGIETTSRIQSPAMLRDNEAAVTFSGLSTRALGGGEPNLTMFTTAQIGSPTNRWLGNNRGAWSNADFDRLFDLFETTLDRTERDRHVIGMVQITSEQLPAFGLYFNTEVLGHLAKVRGPGVGVLGRLPLWNVHEWELT